MTAEGLPLIRSADIASRVAELGTQITLDYRGRRPILVGVLAGALPFLADLCRQVGDTVEVDFLSLSRFGEGGRVRIALDTESNLEDRDVLLVEDIVDTGLTLMVLRRLILARRPQSVATIALLDKATRRLVSVPVEYRGFEVGEEFLVGYGLDLAGKHRNLPDIWAVAGRGESFDPRR